VFKEIHEIIFHGKGGYDWMTIYHMPIWLRKYTFHEIKKFYDEQNKASKGNDPQNQQQSMIDNMGNINKEKFKEASKQYQGRTTYK